MKIKLDFDAYEPTRAHDTDAGLDLRASHSGVVPAHGRAAFDTGVHVQLPPGTYGAVRSRSGLMFNHGITTDGTVDAGYRGQLRVILFNHSDRNYTVKPGEKIAQFVVQPCVIEAIEVVDELDETDRGAAGFGSSGR